MGVWTYLIIGVILFEVWYLVAFLYAYRQIGERLLLLPALQALLMLLAFAYLAVASVVGFDINMGVFIALLVTAMLISLFWRRNPNGLTRFIKSYPRGTLDVLGFRQPSLDLKRRVRTK
ncbi:hypothetical protein [Candidatus Chloroploca asiatica]|uniref:hypothetical protein n=1 Tax=Candidatus Chloroploca asiatica TaxID=1506545 RepID=UPI00114197F4|nr:hypothetical protein [Candidatus Chloroploca asiatica]